MSERRSEIITTARSLLDKKGFSYGVTKERGILQTGIAGRNGNYNIAIDAEKAGVAEFVLLGYLSGPRTHNPELHKALTQLNARFCCVRFLWSPKMEEVCIECSFPVTEAGLDSKQLDYAIQAVVLVADSCRETLERILWVPGMTAEKSIGIKDTEDIKKIEHKKAKSAERSRPLGGPRADECAVN